MIDADPPIPHLANGYRIQILDEDFRFWWGRRIRGLLLDFDGLSRGEEWSLGIGFVHE